MGTKPAPMRIVYRRTDPYGTERTPFEVVRTLEYNELKFRDCARGRHSKCERSVVAPIEVCACECHSEGVD